MTTHIRYKKTKITNFRPRPPKGSKTGIITLIVFFGIIIIMLALNIPWNYLVHIYNLKQRLLCKSA